MPRPLDVVDIEKWFQELEGIWCDIIGKIISSGKIDMDEETWTYLLMFFYLSDVRTAYAVDTFIQESNLLVKACAKLYREHKRIEMSQADSLLLRIALL